MEAYLSGQVRGVRRPIARWESAVKRGATRGRGLKLVELALVVPNGTVQNLFSTDLLLWSALVLEASRQHRAFVVSFMAKRILPSRKVPADHVDVSRAGQYWKEDSHGRKIVPVRTVRLSKGQA